MMRVAQAEQLGGPELLEIVKLPIPSPGPGEVLVRMLAATINYRDLALLRGTSARSAALPHIPLSDGCGIVEALGEGVCRFAIGDRVCPMFFQSWSSGEPTPERLSMALGGELPGVAREWALFHEDGLAKPPAFLSDVEAATLPCAALTAWRSLTDPSALPAGSAVLLQGTGGVSIFALQFAKAAGLKTIMTSSSNPKLERVAALGANELINYVDMPEWGAEARRLTNGRGVDLVVEVGGAATLQQSLTAIRVNGRLSVVGMLSGAQQPINVSAIYASNARIVGITVGSRDMFEVMCRAIDHHRIVPVVDQVFALDEIRSAFDRLASGLHFGKIAVQIA